MKTKLLILLLAGSTAVAFGQTTAKEYYERGRTKSISKNSSEIDAALADLSMAINLKPDYHEAYNLRANTKLGQGDLDGALSDYTKAIELNPKTIEQIPLFAAYYTNRANIRAKLKDFAGALADCDKAIELSPKSIRHYLERGRIRLEQKDYPGAIEDFNKAREVAPDNFAALKPRAEAYRALGQNDLAEADEKKYEAELKKLKALLGL